MLKVALKKVKSVESLMRFLRKASWRGYLFKHLRDQCWAKACECTDRNEKERNLKVKPGSQTRIKMFEDKDIIE